MVKVIKSFLNGLAFGITEMVPGVSASVIAIMLGFYEELIESINHFSENSRKYIKFLIPLFIGIAIGMIVFSSVINYLLANYSFPTMLFFIGLIIGIIPIIFFKLKGSASIFKPHEIVLIILPALAIMAVSHLKSDTAINPAEVIENINVPFMIFLFFSGIVAAAALVIPSVSGSFILLLLDVYHVATYTLASFKNLFLDITNTALLLDICKVLIPLGLGIIIGGLAMIRLIEKLLKKYHRIVYLIILGLLLGSVYTLFSDPIIFQSDTSTAVIIIGIVTLLSGCVASFNIGKVRL